MRTFAAFLACDVKVVFWPRLIVVGFARNVIAGAGGGGGAVGGGSGGAEAGGAAATLFLQPNASREAVRTTNATFLMREELIALSPCRILLGVSGPCRPRIFARVR